LTLLTTARQAPHCAVESLPTTLTVKTGDTITVEHGAYATLVESGGIRSNPRLLGGYGTHATVRAYQDMVLQITPFGGQRSITVCGTASS
jgi:hypothetical protein